MKFDNVLMSIGGAPHIRINRLFGNSHAVWVKSERSNSGGSIKDRIALANLRRTRSRALAPASCRRTSTSACSTA